MGIFKKSTPTTELVEKFNKLSDEEKDKFLCLVGISSDEEAAPAPEKAEEAEEETAPQDEEAAAETPAENAEEKPEEVNAENTEEDAAEFEVDEKVPEEPAEQTSPDIEALLARIDDIEEKYATLLESVNSLLDAADDNKPFGGVSPQLNEGENDGLSEDDRIMKAYMSKQTYRK